MIKKILIVLLTLYSLNASSLGVTDEELEQFAKNWNTLMPEDAYDFIPEKVDYKLLTDPDFQAKINQAGKQLNQSLQNTTIELAGFMVPIEVHNKQVTKFLLVPEAGQCVHVPPPPVNQTLIVDSSNSPTRLRDIYEPIIVSGMLSVGSQTADISNSALSDSNQDAAGALSYNNVESGYTLSEVVVTTLVFEETTE